MSATEHYQAAFDEFIPTRAHEPEWMQQLRRAAFARFVELGLPTRRDERWKYTSLRSFAKLPLKPLSGDDADSQARLTGIDEDAATVLFRDGSLSLAGSSFGKLGVETSLRPLEEAWDEGRPHLEALVEEIEDGVQALNFAFAQGGALIRVGADTSLEHPIVVVHEQSANHAWGSSFTLVEAGRFASATIVEAFRGPEGCESLLGGNTFLQVDEGAHLKHILLQEVDVSAFVATRTCARVARDATCRTFTYSSGARLARHDLDMKVTGEGAHLELSAISLLGGTQQIDHCTKVDHSLPRCTSDQLYRNIADGRAHAVFNGLVNVAQDAQETSAEQMNNNLLLTKQARVDTRPQLEIAADDVKCGHGATIGQLNDEELFYLMSRAIPRAQARRLLILGFAADVVERIELDGLRESIRNRIESWLEATAEEHAL